MHFELSIINGKIVFDIIRAHRADCIEVVRHAYLAHAQGQSVNPDSYFLLDTGWDIEEIRLYDKSPVESEKFRNTACHLEHHRTVTVVPELTQLLRASDLVLFTTVASTPYVADASLFEHNPVVLHISLRDLAPEILIRSQNVVDDVEHVMKANTSPHLTEQQTGSRNFVTGTLAEVMLGHRSVNRSRPIIFSPFGMGILDVAVGKWVYDQAVAAGQDLRLSNFFYEVER